MGISIDKALSITTKGLGRVAPHIMIDNSEEVIKYNAENMEALNTLVMCTKKYQKIQEIVEDRNGKPPLTILNEIIMVVEEWTYYKKKLALIPMEERTIQRTIEENAPIVEAIPKVDYEARLKTDMINMLEVLKKEMNPIKECEYQIYGKEHWNFVGKCQDAIQQKIDKLKENKE